MEVAKKKNRLLRKQKPFLKPYSDISKKRSRSLIQQKEIEDEARKEDPFSSIPEIGVSDDDSDFDDEFVDSLDSGFVQEIDEIQDYNDYAVEMEMLEQFMSKESSMSLSDRIVNIIEEDEKVSAGTRMHHLANAKFERFYNELLSIFLLFTSFQCFLDIIRGIFFTSIGEYLSRYTSGKLPKAFLCIPSKPYWEDALYLTEPEKWSANAMWQATNIFASNMSPKRAQRFYSSVLLPRVRKDIRKNKRLHFDLYKPQARILESVIVGSIIQKASLPADHSSYFIKLLLDKKYAMPYRALDAVVAHFMRFLEDSRVMPVIWHQSLLTLVQRYKYELTKKDKENLERLIQHQKHHLVTEEIRRELRNSRNRGEKEHPTTIFIPASHHHTPIEEDRFNYPIVPMEEEH
ncbi:hypothetical protein MKX03_012082 [Papaver bracteatum]|nr:hypothetical protein MKX03_012082 [Papaver bracteatum]